MKTLLAKLLPGAAALAAVLLIGTWALHAAANNPNTPAPAAPPAAEQTPTSTSAGNGAALSPQIVCGACGEFLQAPAPIWIAQPVAPAARGRYYQGAADRSFYGIPPAGYARPRVVVLEDDCYADNVYRPPAPPASPWLFSAWRMPARMIPPYSSYDPECYAPPAPRHFHGRR